MMLDWSAGTDPGHFALHGVLPYVVPGSYSIISPKNLTSEILRYLQNGNILAARTFIKHFTSSLTSKHPSYVSPGSQGLSMGPGDEIVLTSDPLLNFTQVAVRLCQRAQGDKNKLMRESWVRLCGWYQSKGGPFATKEIRKVCRSRSWLVGGEEMTKCSPLRY